MKPVLYTLVPLALLLLAAYVVWAIRARRSTASVSAEGQPAQTAALTELLDRLDAAGFFAYTDPDRVHEVRARTLKYGFLYGEQIRRAWPADAEDLAEGGVIPFLAAVEPYLRARGVTFGPVAQEFEGDRPYIVTIGIDRYLIYSVAELAGADIWGLALQRTAAILTALLEQAGSAERAYPLYCGNDAQILFLTPAQYALIRDSAALPEGEKPVMVAEPPVPAPA